MAMHLDSIVPFGRSMAEYRAMFHLTDSDLSRSILGVGDGPASFNAEMTAAGYQVISIDPIYEFSGEAIFNRFNQVLEPIIDQVRQTPDDWVWSFHRSVEDLRSTRIAVAKSFLADYEIGRQSGRYRNQQLPSLTFADGSFDLALCSHLLFLYSDHLNYDFHRASLFELLRVANEVRIFPLLTLQRSRSPYLDSLINELRCVGYTVQIDRVEYELQKGGNEMLKITRTCTDTVE